MKRNIRFFGKGIKIRKGIVGTLAKGPNIGIGLLDLILNGQNLILNGQNLTLGI